MDMNGWNMGWMGLLFWTVVILVVVASIKYLFSGPRVYNIAMLRKHDSKARRG